MNRLINSITFENFLSKITFQDVYEMTIGKPDTISRKTKITILFLFSVLLCLPSTNYYILMPTLAVFLLTLFLVKYYLTTPYLRGYNYNNIVFSMIQTAIIFGMTVFLRIKTDTHHLIPWLYIIFAYVLSLSIIYIKIVYVLETDYGIHTRISRKFYGLNKLVSKFLSVFVVLIIIISIFYRTNKWWIRKINLASDNAGMMEYIVWGTVLLAILLGITLLPTQFFSAELYIKGKSLKLYPEEFRKEYDFTKEERYGDG